MVEEVEEESKEAAVTSKEATDRCVFCRSDLGQGARVCPICKTRQKGWGRFWERLPKLLGLLMLFFGVAAYVMSLWPGVRRLLRYREALAVVSFDSRRMVVVANGGDGQLFLSSVRIRVGAFGEKRDSLFAVEQSIMPGEVLSHAFSYSQAEVEIGVASGEGWFIVSGVDEKTWEVLATRALAHADNCVRYHAFSPNDRQFLQVVENYKEKLQELNVEESYIEYWSLRDQQWVRAAIELRALVLVDPECDEFS